MGVHQIISPMNGNEPYGIARMDDAGGVMVAFARGYDTSRIIVGALDRDWEERVEKVRKAQEAKAVAK